MPSFLAITPVRMASVPLELDLDVHAGGQVELHQRVHGLRGGVDDVEHALVRADLELLARLLVDVRRAVDGEALDERGQRDRAAHGRAGALGGVDDLSRGMVQHPVVEGLEPDTDILSIHLALSKALATPEYCVKEPNPRPTGTIPGSFGRANPQNDKDPRLSNHAWARVPPP